MNNPKRVAIDSEMLDKINGGSLGFNPDDHGTFTMECQYSGETYTDVSLSQIMQIAQYSARIPDTPEGERQITTWAKQQGIIK